MQIPSCLHGSGDVISTLDDGTGNMADLLHIVKEIVVHRKPISMNVTLTKVNKINRSDRLSCGN